MRHSLAAHLRSRPWMTRINIFRNKEIIVYISYTVTSIIEYSFKSTVYLHRAARFNVIVNSNVTLVTLTL